MYTVATLIAAQGAAIMLGFLLLPHYLLVLVLYAAVLAFTPALVVGALLAAAARLGPATRSPWFWAGCGGIAMLALFPYLESFGRDPASGTINSVAAIGAGMMGMLAFRSVSGVAPVRELPSRQAYPSTLVAAGVFGTTLVGAIVWRAAYDDRHRFEVRPAGGGMSKATADMTTVYLTLHEYTQSEDDPQYLTTGKSLTMRFARSYLSDANSQAGGALREIRVQVRKDNFAPMGALMAQRNRGDAAHMRAADAAVRRIGTDITLSAIDGPLLGDYASRAKRLAAWTYSDLGEHCGLHFAIEGVSSLKIPATSAFPPSLAIPPDLDVVAAVPDAGEHGASGLNCYAHMDRCHAQFSYHGFPGKFWLPKSQTCEWRAETRRVLAFLDEHLVRQTGRRSGG